MTKRAHGRLYFDTFQTNAHNPPGPPRRVFYWRIGRRGSLHIQPGAPSQFVGAPPPSFVLMAKRPALFRPRGAPSREAQMRIVDRSRGSARDRGYTSEWDRASAAYRREWPLCQYCEAGAFGPVRVRACTRVDHLYPQRRFAGVFWRREWWVASCDDCDAAKQALEHRARADLDNLARRLRRPILDGVGGSNP